MVTLADYKLPVKLPSRNYPHTQKVELPSKMVKDTDKDSA